MFKDRWVAWAKAMGPYGQVTGQFLKVWTMEHALEGNLDPDSILKNWASCLLVWPSFRDLCTCPCCPNASPIPTLQLSALDLPPFLPQVAELQERVESQCQEQAILQRSLQDKAAEVEVERMGAKVSV